MSMKYLTTDVSMNSGTRLPASNQGSTIYKLDEFEQLPDFFVPSLHVE